MNDMMQRLRHSYISGLTRPLSWRVEQLKKLKLLLEELLDDEEHVFGTEDAFFISSLGAQLPPCYQLYFLLLSRLVLVRVREQSHVPFIMFLFGCGKRLLSHFISNSVTTTSSVALFGSCRKNPLFYQSLLDLCKSICLLSHEVNSMHALALRHNGKTGQNCLKGFGYLQFL